MKRRFYTRTVFGNCKKLLKLVIFNGVDTLQFFVIEVNHCFKSSLLISAFLFLQHCTNVNCILFKIHANGILTCLHDDYYQPSRILRLEKVYSLNSLNRFLARLARKEHVLIVSDGKIGSESNYAFSLFPLFFSVQQVCSLTDTAASPIDQRNPEQLNQTFASYIKDLSHSLTDPRRHIARRERFCARDTQLHVDIFRFRVLEP